MKRREFLGCLGAAAVGPKAARSAGGGEGAAAVEYAFDYSLNEGTVRGQKLSLPDFVDVAAKAGYEAVEPWMSSISQCAQGSGGLKDVRKRCSDLGLTICGAIGFATWVVNEDQRRAEGVEQMKRDMDLVAQLGGTRIAAPPAGANRPGYSLDLDRAAERYRDILVLGRKMGVTPQLEVWGSSANLSHLAEAVYVAARAGHEDACILADAFHMYKSGTSPAALKLLGRQAVHCFHLNDYPADPPREAIKDSHRIWPGDGVAPLKDILSNLAANHCRVTLSLELFNPEYWKAPALDIARTGLAKMKAVVRAAGLEPGPAVRSTGDTPNGKERS